MQEVDREVAVVRAQVAHALGLEGDATAALDTYSKVAALHLENSDLTTAVLSASNVAVLRLATCKGGSVATKLTRVRLLHASLMRGMAAIHLMPMST